MESKKLEIPKPKKLICPPCPKTPWIWRFVKFGNKVVIAGSLVYYTARNGAWGTPEESLNFINHFSDHLRVLTPFHIASIIWPDKSSETSSEI